MLISACTNRPESSAIHGDLRYSRGGRDASGFAFLINAHLNILIAGIASFCAAALVNYLLMSQFIFDRIATALGFAVFLFAALIGLSVNVSITVVCISLSSRQSSQRSRELASLSQ